MNAMRCVISRHGRFRLITLVLSVNALLGCSGQSRPSEAASDMAGIGLYAVVMKQSGDVASFSSQRWVRVNRVVPSSPADQAGIAVGDILLKIGDNSVNGSATAMQLIGSAPAGQPLQITILRQGEPREVSVSPQARTKIFPDSPTMNGSLP